MKEERIEIFKELINIGAGKATKTLNCLLNSHIKLTVPIVKWLPNADVREIFEDICDWGMRDLSLIKMRIIGELTGNSQLVFSADDSENLAAEDLHELMRCWENVHRMWQADAHIRTIMFREETRWPGYYFRSDMPSMKKDWEVFANCKWDPKTGEWEMLKRDILHLYE